MEGASLQLISLEIRINRLTSPPLRPRWRNAVNRGRLSAALSSSKDMFRTEKSGENNMFPKSSFLFLPIVLFVIPACGPHLPPIVNSKRDIENLPASQRSVRARFLPDSDIPALARLRELRYIEFASGNAVGPAKITNEGLAELAKLDLPDLDAISLGWCDEITDAGLAHIVRMRTIKTLHLESCPKITDAGLRELLNAKNLTSLDLRGCPNVTDDGIQELGAKKNWEFIFLGGCPKITPQGVAKLQGALPNARVTKNDHEWEQHAPHERSWQKE